MNFVLLEMCIFTLSIHESECKFKIANHDLPFVLYSLEIATSNWIMQQMIVLYLLRQMKNICWFSKRILKVWYVTWSWGLKPVSWFSFAVCCSWSKSRRGEQPISIQLHCKRKHEYDPRVLLQHMHQVPFRGSVIFIFFSKQKWIRLEQSKARDGKSQ